MFMVTGFLKALMESCMEKRAKIIPPGNQGERDRKAPVIWEIKQTHDNYHI